VTEPVAVAPLDEIAPGSGDERIRWAAGRGIPQVVRLVERSEQHRTPQPRGQRRMPRRSDGGAAHSIALLSPRITAALAHDTLRELAVRGIGHQLEHALLEGLWPVLPLRPRAVIQELLVGPAQQARGGALLISQRAPEVTDLAGHG